MYASSEFILRVGTTDGMEPLISVTNFGIIEPYNNNAGLDKF